MVLHIAISSTRSEQVDLKLLSTSNLTNDFPLPLSISDAIKEPAKET